MLAKSMSVMIRRECCWVDSSAATRSTYPCLFIICKLSIPTACPVDAHLRNVVDHVRHERSRHLSDSASSSGDDDDNAAAADAPRPCIERYSFAEIFRCVELWQHMKPGADMKSMLLVACDVLLEEPVRAEVKLKVNAGSIRYPSQSTLRKAVSKIDAVCLWQDRLLWQPDTPHHTVGSLMLDGSLQHGYNNLCAVVDTMYIPMQLSNMTQEDRCSLDFGPLYHRVQTPIWVLGVWRRGPRTQASGTGPCGKGLHW